MSKTRLIILAGFALAFGAGVVTGMLGHRTVFDPPRHHMSLVQELELTPAQAEQMQQIWQGVMRDMGRHQEEQRRAMRKERDDAIVALLQPEQKAAYEKIQQQY